MDYRIYKLVTMLIIFTSLTFAQEKSFQEQQDSTSKVNSTSSVDGTAAINDEINFKNATGNSIITITDEGSNKGSITLPELSAEPASTTNDKLYNLNGVLNFDGSALGNGATKIGELNDAYTTTYSLFLGLNSGLSNIGAYNTAVGIDALKDVTNGSINSAFGNFALYKNNGGQNLALGSSALRENTIGSYNTAVGESALRKHSTGDFNTAVGDDALYNNISGTGNVALGRGAGRDETGDNKLYINNDEDPSPLIWGDFTDGSEEVKINGDLGVTGTTKIGVSGVAIAEIIKLTGVTDGSSTTYINYPTGYDLNNSYVLSCKIRTTVGGLGVYWYTSLGNFTAGDDNSVYVNLLNTSIGLKRSDGQYAGAEYSLILMRID